MNFVAKMAAATQTHLDLLKKFPLECKTGPCLERALRSPDKRLDGYCVTCQVNIRLGMLVELLSGSKTIEVHTSQQSNPEPQQPSIDFSPMIEAIERLSNKVSGMASPEIASASGFGLKQDEAIYTPVPVQRKSGKVRQTKANSNKPKKKATAAADALSGLNLPD